VPAAQMSYIHITGHMTSMFCDFLETGFWTWYFCAVNHRFTLMFHCTGTVATSTTN